MDKILIRLQVPAISRLFDVFVPVDLKIDDLTEVLNNGVMEMSNHAYIPSYKEKLNLNGNILLNPQLTLKSYGIKDGEKIILI